MKPQPARRAPCIKSSRLPALIKREVHVSFCLSHKTSNLADNVTSPVLENPERKRFHLPRVRQSLLPRVCLKDRSSLLSDLRLGPFPHKIEPCSCRRNCSRPQARLPHHLLSLGAPYPSFMSVGKSLASEEEATRCSSARATLA